MRSKVLPPVGSADLSDSPPSESAVPAGWPSKLVPNFSEWLSADIVLVGSDGTRAARAIQAAQRTSFSAVTRAGYEYTHAALYLGDGRLIDATVASGISERSVWDYCGHRKLTVRRVPGLSPTDINDIVNKAKTHLGKNYAWLGVVISKLIPKTEPNPKRLYCSTFVGLSIDQGSGRKLASLPEHKPLYPGTLMAHPGLDQIELEWRPV